MKITKGFIGVFSFVFVMGVSLLFLFLMTTICLESNDPGNVILSCKSTGSELSRSSVT